MNDYKCFLVILPQKSAVFPCRNKGFDSTLGSCLDALHSMCPTDVVRLTAAELVSVFYNSLPKTKSTELQVKFIALFFDKEKGSIYDILTNLHVLLFLILRLCLY